MDLRNWKKVLMHWVTECGFVAGNYFSLDQTDIDEFYKNYQLNHTLLQKTKPEGNLIDFLKEQYADYTPLLDDDNAVSTTEYIYIYSLLLHFSCVKYPETNFHDICKRLAPTNQRYIAAFFNELLECETINRDKLRQAIASTAQKNASSSVGDSNSSGNNSSGNNLNFFSSAAAASTSFTRPESPYRTSRFSNSSGGNSISTRIMPPTPKSAMLEERTRELYNLRAQLETERYEKGQLEVQIKQNEEKIKKLNQDHKKLQQTIQDLRNDILTKNTEDYSIPNNDGAQINRRLCREVAEKEAEIAKLNEAIGNMMEEMSLTQEKLRFAEKQIVFCMDRITELDFKVDELTAEVEQKECTIKCLTESKNELEQFINETRSTANNNSSRPDYLDSSFSPPGTDISANSNSPENLARSVVDVQLREKEHENAELREELYTLKNSQKRLTDLISKFTIKHAQEFNIATTMTSSISAKKEENIEVTPGDCLDHLVDYVERIGALYKEEKERVKMLQADLQSKQMRNDELERRLVELDEQIIALKEQVKQMSDVNIDLEQTKQHMQEKIACAEQELVKVKEQKHELVAKLESLANDYDTHKQKCAEEQQELCTQIEGLGKANAEHEECNATLEKENKQLNDEMVTLQNEIQALQQSLHTNNDELRTLNERNKSFESELEAHTKTEQMLKEKYEKLLVQNEASKRDRRETAEHLEAMRNKIAVKELEMGKLGGEIVEMRQKNAALEQRIDKLTNEYKTDKQNAETEIQARKEQIRKLSEERDELAENVSELQSEHELRQKELREAKEELAAALKTCDALKLLLANDNAQSGEEEEGGEQATNLAQKLGDVVANVKRLQLERNELDNKLAGVNTKHAESIAKMEHMEEQMKMLKKAKEDLADNYKTLCEQSELEARNAEEQIKLHEEDVGALKRALQQVKEDMANALQASAADHTKHLMAVAVEHDRVVNALKEQLQANEEQLSLKQRELQTLLEESAEVKRKLAESVQRLEAVNAEQTLYYETNAEKLQALEDRMHNVLNENENLHKEIETYKAEHAKVNEQVAKADGALTELNGKLLREAQCKSELSIKLQASEARLAETEQKLDGIMKEKTHEISALRTAYDSQTVALKRCESEVNALEQIKMKQLEQITALEEKLQSSSEEKERLGEEKERLVEEKQCLAEEKQRLAEETKRLAEEKQRLVAQIQKAREESNSHEQTAQQLKLAIGEREQEMQVLQQTSAKLKQQISEANERCAKLQADLAAKEAQLQRGQEEQAHERVNWQKQGADMQRQLDEQTLMQETNESKLQELINVMENQLNAICDGRAVDAMAAKTKPDELVVNKLHEYIKVGEHDKATRWGKIKYALNRLLSQIADLRAQLQQIEQKRQGAVEVLEKANDKLNAQLLQRNAEITELQQQLLGERNNSALAEQLQKELNALRGVQEQYRSATTALERLQCEKQELKSELQRANDNVSSLIQGSNALRQEKETLMEQLQGMRQELTQTSAQHSSTESMVRNILQNSTKLTGKLDATEHELKLMRVELKTLESRRDELMAENKKLRETVEGKEKRIEKLSVKTGDLLARCSKAEHENNKLNESLASAKETNEKLQREKCTLEKDKQTLQERLTATERTQQQLMNKIHQLEQVKLAHETERKRLADAEADAKAKLTKLEKIRQTNEEKIRKLNYSLETSEANNVRLNHEIGAINSQLNELKNSASAERVAVEKSTAEQLDGMRQERDTALERAKEYETLAQQLQRDVEQLQEQNTDNCDKLAKLSLALQISQEKYDALAQQIRDLVIDMCALKEEKAQIETEHTQTCDKLKAAEMASDNLRAEREEQIVTLEAQLTELKKALTTRTEEFALLQTERDALLQRNGNGNDAQDDEPQVQEMRKRLCVAEALAESEQKANAQLRVDNQILQAKYRESKQRLQDATQAGEERIKENRLEMEGKLEKMKNKMKTLYTEEVTKMKGKQERELTSLRTEMDQLKAQNIKYEEHVNKLSKQLMRSNDCILEYKKQIAIQNIRLKELQENICEDNRFKRPSFATNSLPRTLSSLSAAAPTPTNAAAMGSNLAMEDEEGEVFNNTYLTDLQTGRMSMCRDVCAEELQYRNSLCPPHLKSTYAAQYDHGLPEDELKDGPNSLDDSMSALLSTTSGGGGGARKKLTGITNYKRPGPPTPGKHGGRLSLGSSEPPREILKELNEHRSAKTPIRFGFFASKFSMGNSNAKDETAAKLPIDLLKAVQMKNFESMCLKKSPETAICTSTPRKSKSHYDRRFLFEQFMALTGSSSSSTRLSLTVEKPTEALCQTQAPTLCLADVSAIHGPAVQSHLKMLEQQRVARKRRSSLLRLQIGRRMRQVPAASSQLSSETPSTAPSPQRQRKQQRLEGETPLTTASLGAYAPYTGSATTTTTTSAASSVSGKTTATTTTATTTTASSADRRSSSGRHRIRHHQRHKRDRGPRLSLYASGSSFRTTNRAKLREQMCKKAHKQRRDNFNRGRALSLDKRCKGGAYQQDGQLVIGSDGMLRDSEDSNHSRAIRLNATIVLSKKCDYPEDYDIPEYTSNYFSDLLENGTATMTIEESSAEGKTFTGKSQEMDEISADYAYNTNDTQLTRYEEESDTNAKGQWQVNETTKRNQQSFFGNGDNTENDDKDDDDDDTENSQNSIATLPVEQSLMQEAADEPSTLEELEIFESRCKQFEELAADTISAAPFTITNMEFNVMMSSTTTTPTTQSLPPPSSAALHANVAKQRGNSITYTLLPSPATVAAASFKPPANAAKTAISTTIAGDPMLFVKALNEANKASLSDDDAEMKITLADVTRMWSSIWMRFDQQLQLTIILAVFGPLIVLVYLTLSQYA